MKFNSFLRELKKLGLPAEQYAIVGSGPLAVRGLRDAGDLDLIVKPGLWKNLCKRFPAENNKVIRIGKIEIFKNWEPWLENTDELIETAEIINGFPFVRLEFIAEWKKKMKREKDLKDLELIKDFRHNSF